MKNNSTKFFSFFFLEGGGLATALRAPARDSVHAPPFRVSSVPSIVTRLPACERASMPSFRRPREQTCRVARNRDIFFLPPPIPQYFPNKNKKKEANVHVLLYSYVALQYCFYEVLEYSRTASQSTVKYFVIFHYISL